MRIYLDAGHGGNSDVGAINGKIKEKDLNLQIANKLEILLRGSGNTVMMSRKTDKQKSLHNRAYECNHYEYDLLVSIHCNSVKNKLVDDAETIYFPGSKKGKKLAESIIKSIEYFTLEAHRRAKPDDRGLYVLRATKCPAVIVEAGFMSNELECMELQTLSYQWTLAIAIFEGIKNYIGDDNND